MQPPLRGRQSLWENLEFPRSRRSRQEGIAYAEIDLNRSVEPKQFHDVVGYYNRFDIFDLSIDRTRLTPARFFDHAQVVAAAEPQIRKDTIKTVEPAPTSRE
jgi:hypothetical protein